ncbi:MAG TPA: hypothetical protein VFF09_03655 [archaeon]|nr:hypothetical protein [archaeon]
MDEKGFAQELAGIRQAEKEKVKILADAAKEAEKTVSNANIGAKKMLSDASDESKKIEDEIIAKAREELAAEEKKMLEKASKEAEKIISVKISAGALKKALEKAAGE